MQRRLHKYYESQVFLNYPFDDEFRELEHALHFPVVAAGLIPICAKGLSVPDKPRLEMIVEAIKNCHYSAHDFSRLKGEGSENFGRMNMPLEMGMAIFHALETQRNNHRCAFFVSAPHNYSRAISDLAGLDPYCYQNDPKKLVSNTYDWLRRVLPSDRFISASTIEIVDKYEEFKITLQSINGGGENGMPTYSESIELMYRICEECGWWDWRGTRDGKLEFPEIPLSFKKC